MPQQEVTPYRWRLNILSPVTIAAVYMVEGFVLSWIH